MCVSEDSPSHGSSIGDKVSDWLHDVPGVLPPRQPRQDAELDAHHAEPEPNEVVRPLVRQLGQLLPPLLERGQLRLQLLDLPYQALLL